jgi:hypothetical protein
VLGVLLLRVMLLLLVWRWAWLLLQPALCPSAWLL